MEKIQEIFVKDLEELKNKETEVNNTLERISSRIIEAEEWASDPENRMVEITAADQNIEKRIINKPTTTTTTKNEDSLRTLWDNIKCINICIIGVPEEKREKGLEKIFEEIKTGNFSNMGKETVNLVQEVQEVPSILNPRRNTLRHIVIKLTKIKDKDKIIKATKEK